MGLLDLLRFPVSLGISDSDGWPRSTVAQLIQPHRNHLHIFPRIFIKGTSENLTKAPNAYGSETVRVRKCLCGERQAVTRQGRCDICLVLNLFHLI